MNFTIPIEVQIKTVKFLITLAVIYDSDRAVGTIIFVLN